MIRRTRRPTLLGTAARTAVVAGTASTVVGRNQQRREAEAQQAAKADAFEAQQNQQAIDDAAAGAVSDLQAQSQAPAGTPSAPPATDMLTQLESLADLMTNGFLTPEEFTAAKKSLLNL